MYMMFSAITKVLIVDDDPACRDIVAYLLHEWGTFDVQEASDGDHAWSILLKMSPPVNLVISDRNMPLCGGIELLKKVRSSNELQNTYFILISGDANEEQIAESILLGANAYLAKPFAPEKLKETLTALPRVSYLGKIQSPLPSADGMEHLPSETNAEI